MNCLDTLSVWLSVVYSEIVLNKLTSKLNLTLNDVDVKEKNN